MTTLPAGMYRFSARLVKITTRFFTDLEKKTFSFVWRLKKPRIAIRTGGTFTIPKRLAYMLRFMI